MVEPSNMRPSEWTPIEIPHDHPPCKHEWRQYMAPGFVEHSEPGETVWVMDGQAPAREFMLRPDGYFCIHCPARSDENRVVTNPEAL